MNYISGIKRNLKNIATKTANFVKAGLEYQMAMGLECHSIREWHDNWVKAGDTPRIVEETVNTLVKGVMQDVTFNLKAYKQFFNYLRAIGEMPFSYVQSSKYTNVYKNRDKFEGIDKQVLADLGITNSNLAPQFATFEFTEGITPEGRIEEWTDAQEVKAAAAALNAPAERASTTFKGDNEDAKFGYAISWELDVHGSTENALVGLMNRLVRKYVRKLDAANVQEIVLANSEAVNV